MSNVAAAVSKCSSCCNRGGREGGREGVIMREDAIEVAATHAHLGGGGRGRGEEGKRRG